MKTKLWNCGTCFVDNIGEICTNCESNNNIDIVNIIITEAEREAISIGQSLRRGDQSKKTSFLFIMSEAKKLKSQLLKEGRK